MTSVSPWVRSCSAGFAVLLTGVAGGAAAETLGYDVYVGGLRLAEASTRIDLTGDRYDMRLAARTTGVAATFSGWWTEMRSTGSFSGDTVVPERYRTERPDDDGTVLTDFHFRPDGTVTIERTPPRQPGSEDGWLSDEPIAPDILAASLDPLSGFVAGALSMGRAGQCAGRFSIYDGRRVIAAEVVDGGLEILEATAYSPYAGPAMRCTVQLDPVAGDFRPRTAFGRSYWAGDRKPEERRFDVWFAELPGQDAPLPVKIQSESALGRVVVHLARVTTEAAVRP